MCSEHRELHESKLATTAFYVIRAVPNSNSYSPRCRITCQVDYSRFRPNSDARHFIKLTRVMHGICIFVLHSFLELLVLEFGRIVAKPLFGTALVYTLKHEHSMSLAGQDSVRNLCGKWIIHSK